MMDRHRRFGLVLMVTHACNLRCTYCYTGAKTARTMDGAVARHAIDRALASIAPGGLLDLGLFGGEPLLEPAMVARLMAYTRERAEVARVGARFSITTNGTRAQGAAWAVLCDPDVDLAISSDGLPSAHDRHRRTADGQPTSQLVEATIARLVAAGRDFRAVAVVRPDSLDRLVEGVSHLHGLGVPAVELSLDLWTRWSDADGGRLDEALAELGAAWRRHLPRWRINWFDEALAKRSRLPHEPTRCGFGVGDVAVAPSGNLYPCERLIGEDGPRNPARLPGHALAGDDFLALAPPASARDPACGGCALSAVCGTTCRCSNFVRTGDAGRPDGLLCLLERLCAREALAVRRAS